jgi:hypothetical protein
MDTTETALSRREATLRSAATACLAGIALVQATELPSLLSQGRQLAVLCITAMALSVGLGCALAAAPAGATRQLWRMVAATAVLVLGGWAAPGAFPVPGLLTAQEHWTTAPAAALAAVCLVLAVAAAPSRRTAVRELATAAVPLFVTVAALLVALEPAAAAQGQTAIVAGGHIHSAAAAPVSEHLAHISYDNSIQFKPGEHGGRYVVSVATPPHATILWVVLLAAAALVFLSGAVGFLRRRSGPGAPAALGGAEQGLA